MAAGWRADTFEDDTMKNQVFTHDADIAWTPTEPGVRRKVLGYNDGVMMVRVDFERGAVGSLHQHVHVQCTLIESGAFDVTISGKTEHMVAGDCFLVPSNEIHGVVATEAGVLVDVFTPMRGEFV
jgi:quercetin dioxygenase-like cupin family protein